MQNIAENKGSSGIIISIKPVYAEMILSGRKRYEFRRRGFTRKIGRVFMYSTKPVSKIVGYFTFDEILNGSPSEVWGICSENAGISESDFYKYYKNAETAFAIKVNSVFRLPKPISPFNVLEGFKVPRSFFYVDSNIFSSVEC
jgi:predicted transcriptional regulator